MATVMQAKDAVSASLAECFVTIGDNRYNFMQAINLEANFEKNKTEIPILGKTGKGNKSTGWSGTGSATFHYNTSIFRQMMKQYKDTGEDVYFDIQVTNEDPTSSVGRQSLTLMRNTWMKIWTSLLRISRCRKPLPCLREWSNIAKTRPILIMWAGFSFFNFKIGGF